MGLRKNNSSVFSFPMVDIHLRKLQWVYFLRHAGVKGNDRADRLGGKTNPHNCFSEDLKCWGASNTTCQHKAKDFIPSIAWRRWHQSDEDWNCFTGNVGKRLRRSRAHIGISDRIDTILTWTKLSSGFWPLSFFPHSFYALYIIHFYSFIHVKHFVYEWCLVIFYSSVV